jgi:signal transduction histidine kinase
MASNIMSGEPRGPSPEQPIPISLYENEPSSKTRQGRFYLACLLLVQAALLVASSSNLLTAYPEIVAFGAAIAAGALLTVRLRPGSDGAVLTIVPLMVTFDRFNGAALPILVLASTVAALVRRRGRERLILMVTNDGLAFAIGSGVAQLLGESVIATIAFGLVFILARAGLWHLSQRTVGARPIEYSGTVMSLLLAPLAAIPLALGNRLGDGGLLVSLAGLLALLLLVCEATNLATARSEVESEREQLAQAILLQEELMHLITHDLKNPLTTVLATSQLGKRAMERRSYDRIVQYFDNIEHASVSMRRLIENLSHLNSLDGVVMLPAAVLIDVPSLAKEVVDELAPLADQKRQTVRTAEAKLPPVLAPTLLLREALSNLIGNAIKYTPEGGEISVKCELGDAPGLLTLSIADNGIGIAESDQARLFTKFFRSTDPRATAQRGSGLGLALTNSVIHRLGGRILVRSALDQGTTFVIELPTVSNAAA